MNILYTAVAILLYDSSITFAIKFSRESFSIDEYKDAGIYGRLQTRLIRVASNRVIRKTLFRSAARARARAGASEKYITSRCAKLPGTFPYFN